MPDYSSLYRGVVYDVADPENRGRVRVLIPAVLGNSPSGWAEPMLDTKQQQHYVDELVWVEFEGGDVNRPTYFPRPYLASRDLNLPDVAAGVQPHLTLLDPTAPASSPLITVTGMPTALLVETQAILPGHAIQYHISTDPTLRDSTPNDPATASGVPTRSTVYVALTYPDGTPLDPNTDYFVWAVALSPDIPGSEAAPSPMVQGRLDLSAIDTFIASKLIAGFILAGNIQVGQMVIDANDGITIPYGALGVTRFPVDGVTAPTLAGFILASAGITVQGNANFYGLTQIGGDFKMLSGIQDPTLKIGVTKTWDQMPRTPWYDATARPVSDANIGGTITSLALPDAASGKLYSTYRFMNVLKIVITDPSPTATVLGSTEIADITGAGTDQFGSWGMTGLGGYLYALGADLSKTGVQNVYKITRTSPYTKVASFAVTGNYPNGACIGTDGTNLKMVFVNSNGVMWLRTYSPTGTILNTDQQLMTGTPAANLTPTGVYYGPADMGADRLVVSFLNASVMVWSGAASGNLSRLASRDFLRAANVKSQGFVWDGIRFKTLDQNGIIRSYSTGNLGDSTVYAGYTWYDGDASVGTTHETAVSPAASFTRPARAKLVLDAKPAPDAGVTDPAQTDKANLVRVYAGATSSTMRLQSGGGTNGALPLNATHLELETMDTSLSLAPTAGNFTTATGGVGRLLAGGGGFWVDGQSNGSVGTGTFRDSVIAARPQPTVAWFQSTSTASIPNTTFTLITGWTDLAGYTSHSYCTIPGGSGSPAGTSTILESGTFDIGAAVSMATSATGRRLVAIYVNGVEVKRTDVGIGGSASTVQVTAKMYLSSGDQVAVYVWQNSTAAISLNFHHDFQIMKLT